MTPLTAKSLSTRSQVEDLLTEGAEAARLRETTPFEKFAGPVSKQIVVCCSEPAAEEGGPWRDSALMVLNPLHFRQQPHAMEQAN